MKQNLIYLAEPRGFCFGVKKALQILDKVISDYPEGPIYVFNEIVHNKPLVDAYKAKGITFTKDEQQIPDYAIVVISAHGCAPQVRDTLRAQCQKLIDATCPLVNKVHDEVHEYSKQGEHIVYIGDPGHDEAKGVIAENPENISVVYSEKDIARIPKTFSEYRLLNQTTLNLRDVEHLASLIRHQVKHLNTPPKKDVCFASTSRQDIVRKLARKCDLFLVIGSQNSSNSIKLKNIAAQYSTAYLVDSAKELNTEWLHNVTKIGITAGASAPEYLVQEMVDYLVGKGFKLSQKRKKK